MKKQEPRLNLAVLMFRCLDWDRAWQWILKWSNSGKQAVIALQEMAVLIA